MGYVNLAQKRDELCVPRDGIAMGQILLNFYTCSFIE